MIAHLSDADVLRVIVEYIEADKGTMKSFFEEVEGVRADMESIRRVMAEVGVKQSALLSEPRCEERLKVQFRSSSRGHMGNAEIYFWML